MKHSSLLTGKLFNNLTGENVERLGTVGYLLSILNPVLSVLSHPII